MAMERNIAANARSIFFMMVTFVHVVEFNSGRRPQIKNSKKKESTGRYMKAISWPIRNPELSVQDLNNLKHGFTRRCYHHSNIRRTSPSRTPDSPCNLSICLDRPSLVSNGDSQ